MGELRATKAKDRGIHRMLLFKKETVNSVAEQLKAAIGT